MKKNKGYIIAAIVLIVFILLLVSTNLVNNITGQAGSKYKTCNEDDGGNNKDAKGTVIFTRYGREYKYVDYCDRQRRVVEYYCLYDGVKTKRHYCDTNCTDGACATTEINLTCTDSDNGIDYYVEGKACVDSDCKTDFCIDKNYISEFYCVNNRIPKLYKCPKGCENGECIAGTIINATG